ncbi:hypothetical protein FHL15_000841 [Xylaria flabelliformis]|uniref:Uncharacterized protein n=1 Tax=Xylaria flabelliformis TaxID=2512241 RepID=A0A553IDB9_9PEZI|nr:hypothetical protein FHL15_000841 [Xylaria flabelliformis]
MVNQPWHELHHGPQDAAKTVLLDYIWPLQITSFAMALKNRHLAVATAILVFTLLKLVMVISTTLFVLGDSVSSQDIRAQLLTKFDAANYLNSTRLVTSDPIWDYLDLREEYRDTAPPLELSVAFTNYSINSKLPRGADKTSVQVNVFQVNATCETTTVDRSQNDPSKSFNLTLKTPSCDIGRIEVAACSPENADSCGSGAKYFQSGLVGCKGQGYAALNFGDARVATDEYRLAIVTIESDLTLASELETWLSNFSVNVRRIAAVSCGLEYSINQGVAHGPAFDTKVDSLEITDGQQSQINNLTGLEVLDAIVVSASNASTTNSSYSITLMYNGHLDLLGLLTDSRTITPTTFDPLLDISSLKSRAEETLTGLSHQLMRRYFFLPDNTTTSGSVNYTEQKLYTRAAALWTMVGLLAIISCFVLVVAAYSQQGVAPRSPATLANAAYIMSRSPAMAISGLWVDTAIKISRDVAVEVQSDWNISFTENAINFYSGSYVSEDTIALFNDAEHGLPDKAELIWGNVMLPRVGNPQPSITSQLEETLNGGTPQYNIAVPAVRPFLQCSSLPPSAIFTATQSHNYLDTTSPYPPTRTFGAMTVLPTGCVDAYASGEQAKTISLSYDFDDNTTSGWIGRIYDLSVIWNSDKAPAEGCPSLGVIFGTRLVNGPRGTSRENLIGSVNVDTLMAAMNDLYQRFMVRVLDLEWRSTIGGENATQPTPNGRVARGSIIVPVSRLKLNKTSKIVLQTFLGTMVLLGGIAWWCVDMRVLPRNPYPIASSMALFAGSRLIGASGQAPNGSREQEQQWKIKRKPLVIVKGRRFRLGWWEGSNAAANNGSDSDAVSQALLPTAGRRFGIDVEDKDKAVSSTASKTTSRTLDRHRDVAP